MFHLFSVYINITQFKIKENIISSDYFSKGNEDLAKISCSIFLEEKYKIITEKPLFLRRRFRLFPQTSLTRPRAASSSLPAGLCEPHHSLAALLWASDAPLRPSG